MSELISPSIPIATASAQLTFRNSFNLESGFDGTVLEASINGGAFEDIITAGGSFVSGGYNATLNTGFGNPLPGRMAWSGLSGGATAAPEYITTVVNLPAAAAGQNVQFQWRTGSDATLVPAGSIGQRIDGISLRDGFLCAPIPTLAVSRKMHGGLGPFDVDLLTAVPPRTECRTGGAGGNHQVVVTFPNPVTVTDVSVTSIDNMATATQSVSGAEVTVELADVSNAQRAGITLLGVSDGLNTGDVFVPMSVLAGDTTGNGFVTASDIGQTKGQSGQAVSASNFRTDVTANGGSITASDIGLVKSKSGTQLP